MNAQLLEQARKLDLDERLELIEALWDDIADRGETPLLTSSQKTELDHRLADHQDHPDEVVPWDDIKAAAQARLTR